ncbi:TetR/AcrR family transcriptional regulator [Holzapfeliella floricola]|uniref:HTH tetR-type domain-containing protein n=1 Tax=Holzapfeliella floricola DSM 23037 = JCM 16512 TaxID=1423744 RepID=A0A0R2DVY8_9LACO|nr:TetR/AcrR family transcriptional regulator [Holzapfeliella floricola]KRN04714.1 hypothetical protein FC86_GL001070 [Holzapfeliella floricola DSM 23037 = JCM 16512]
MAKRNTVGYDRVIEMAIKIIEDEGPEELTFRNLAKALDIKSQSLYNYFKNQSELLEELGTQFVRWLHQELTEGLIGYSGKKALIKYAEIIRNYFSERGQSISLIHKVKNYDKSSDFFVEMKKVIDLIDRILDSIDLHGVDKTSFGEGYISQILGFLLIEQLGFLDQYGLPHNDESFRQMLELSTKIID